MRRCDADEHDYDESKYSQCPYCRQTRIKSTPVAPNPPVDHAAAASNKTKLITNNEEPEVVGWLVVIDGPGKGKDIRIIPGMNRIGRDAGMELRIDFGDETISRREQAFIIYDPKYTRYYLKQGRGQNLVYLNGELVLEPKPLEPQDRITLGRTECMFIPLCSDRFHWEKNGSNPSHGQK